MKKMLALFISLLIFSNCNKENPPDPFEHSGPIFIHSFNPISGFCGDEITIMGENFALNLQLNQVSVNGVEAKVIQASADQLKIQLPDGATTGKIKIQINAETATSTQDFEVLIPEVPIITGFSPEGGAPGNTIQIFGENFGENLGFGTSVQIGGVEANIVEQSPTKLKVVVPSTNSSSKISVNVKGQIAQTDENFKIFSTDIQKALDDLIANNPNIPSISLAVVKDGKPFYTYGAGVYDGAKTKRPDHTTLYFTSSLSKLIISVAIMQQVEQGNLDIDADINNYLPFEVRNPNFPNTIITPKMLMQHSASLANPFPGEAAEDIFFARDPTVPVNLHPLIEDILTPESEVYNSAIWMNEKPGTITKNSNFGMTLLGYLVEVLSDQHFNDYTREHILLPLGMNTSSYFYPDLNPDNVAALFIGTSNETLLEPFTLWQYPAGLLFTSGEDWSKFMMAILNKGSYNGNQILQSNSVEMLLNAITPSNNLLPYSSNIGLIWRQSALNPGWFGHTGAGGTVTHVSEINPDKNLGYVVFTNEGALGFIIGPGGTLNTIIHQWLDEL